MFGHHIFNLVVHRSSQFRRRMNELHSAAICNAKIAIIFCMECARLHYLCKQKRTMDYIKAIESRHSVRNYTEQPLTENQISVLREAIAEVSAPFGGKVKIMLARKADGTLFKPSTYGVIRGATDYLLMYLSDDLESRLSGGYALERVVLAATSMGLGTCWVGGTFSAGSFNHVSDIPAGLKLTIVCPVGIAAPKQGLLSRITSAIACSKSRKPMTQLFFQDSTGTPLQPGNPYYEALEMMRLAPSSVNSQPWRAIVSADNSEVSFYATSLKPLNEIDMGIGLCHFALAMQAKGKRGHFSMTPPESESPAGLYFVARYQ